MVARKAPTWPCCKVRNTGGTKRILNSVDYEGVKTVIDGVAKKLFKQDGTVELLICRWGDQEKLRPTPIFSYDELDIYIERHIPSNQTSPNKLLPNRISTNHNLSSQIPPDQPPPSYRQPRSTHLFLIDQEHTKSGLDITQDGLSLLLSSINAFPQLGSALPAFAASDIPVHEGRSAFNARRDIDFNGDPTFELSMLLKYVEPNGNKSDPIPYSIRQQLLYQKYRGKHDGETIVLFRASMALKRRITEEYHAPGENASHWVNLPILTVSTLGSHWAEYCTFLDEGVWKIDKSSTHTNPFLPSLGEANTNTLQATQKYHDLLTRAVHVLQNNIRILVSLGRESNKRKLVDRDTPSYDAEYYQVLDQTIEDVKEDLEGFIKHLDLIQARLSRITEGIRDSIALRSSHHAAVETQNMRNLTTQSIREARTVKAIALVTLVYLPATFVATFLGMNTLEVRSESRGRLGVSVDPELWVYLALTIPLTLCTLAAWWAWEWWSRRNQTELLGVSWKQEEEEA